MLASLPEKVRTRLVLAAVGLIQGLVYYLAHEFWPDTTTPRALIAAALFFTTGLALTNLLAWTGKDVKRLLFVGSVAPLIFALAALWVWLQIPTGDVPYRDDSVRLPTSIFSAILSLSILLPGIQVFQATGSRSFPYAELFRRYWDNIFVMMTAGFVMGAFWTVILLWSELFKLIDVTVFDDVFTHAAFVCMGLSVVFSYGVALGREWEKITATIRSILFTVLKALMPLLAIIALLFLVSLPFTGLQPLWDTRHASATLLSLIALTILFFNGAFLDGTGDPPYSRWIRHLVEASLVAIPVYAVITFYALSLRIGQYGLTFGRFYGVLFAIGGMLCGLGYAVSVFRRRDQWMDTARFVNVGMGCVIVCCAVLVHTPVLDPLAWSARSQFSRIVNEEVDAAEFDYGYLRFHLGHNGFEKLADLEELTNHPQADVIRDRVRETRAAESYAEVRPQPASLITASDIVFLDDSAPVPDSLIRYIVTHLTQFQADECEENGDCTMFAANLDSDPEPEYALVLSGEQYYEILAFDRDEAGEWKQVGWLRRHDPGARFPVRTALLDTLRQNGPISEEARYRDLVIGGLKLRVMN
jgi:hypothetical protein